MSGRRGLLFIDERAAIDKEEIEPSVIVVIQHQAPACHRLRHVFLRTGAVLVFERQTGFRRDVGKPHWRRFLDTAGDDTGSEEDDNKNQNRSDGMHQRNSSSSAASIVRTYKARNFRADF